MKKAVFHPKFQKIAIPVVHAAFKLFFGFKVDGKENIPEGPCVIAPNHVQASDPCFVAAVLGTQTPLRAMGKKEVFEIPFLGRLITWLGAFPVDRSTADLNAVRTALRAVQNGNRLLIFPQGTRGGKENAAKNGAAMLAVKTKAPIVPVYIPPNKKFRSRPTIVIGKPYLPEQTRDYEKVSQDLMQRVYELERGL